MEDVMGRSGARPRILPWAVVAMDIDTGNPLTR
jgi:hypothetical protein